MKRKATTQGRSIAKRPALSPAQHAEVQRQVNATLARQKDYKITTRELSATGQDFTGNTYDLLSNMSRGDNARDNFEGSHISIKNFRIRGSIAVADNTNSVRFCIFQWYDDTAPVTTSIFDNAGIIGTVNAPYATRNWSNRPIYKILKDEIIQLQNTSVTSGGPWGNVYAIDWWISGKKLQKTFYAATSVTKQKGGIYMAVVSDSGAAPHPTLIFTSEVIFTDE